MRKFRRTVIGRKIGNYCVEKLEMYNIGRINAQA